MDHIIWLISGILKIFTPVNVTWKFQVGMHFRAFFLVSTPLFYKDFDLYGKTGTDENPHGDNHAWIVGWADYYNEKLV